MVRRSRMFLCAAGLGTLLYGAPVLAHGGESKGTSISKSDMPAPVADTFRRESEGGKVEELRKTTSKDGKTIYEGEVVKEHSGIDLKVDDSGKVIHRSKPHDERKESEHEGK